MSLQLSAVSNRGRARADAALAFGLADSSLGTPPAAATVTLYEARTGIDLQRVIHPQPVRQFAFGADETLLATVCDDQTVRIWRT